MLGAIAHRHLLDAVNRGFRPTVRVFLQEIGLDGRSGSRVREMKGFSQIRISRQIGSKGSASIVFANLDDRYFQGRGEGNNGRQFSGDFEKLTKRALRNALRPALPYIKEINPLRRTGNENLAFQGANAFLGDRLNEYINFVYNFTATQGVKLRRGQLTRTGAQFSDLVTLGLMQRVFIDIVGQDGRVYAGFSGLVSGVTDEYTPGSAPVVTLNCTDLWRLFDIAEIVVKEGQGVDDPGRSTTDTVKDNLFFDVQSRLGLRNDDYRASIFQNVPGQVIVHQIMRLTQSTLCFIPNVQLVIQQGVKRFAELFGKFGKGVEELLEKNIRERTDFPQNEEVVKIRREFFFDDAFWRLPAEKDLTSAYEGVNPLRRVRPGFVLSRAIGSDGTDRVDENGGKIDELRVERPTRPGSRNAARQDGDGIVDGDFIGTLLGELFIDKFIETGTQSIVYRELINSILGPWQVQHSTGTAILRKIMDATFYDMYFTGNGDFVYQIPRYNNFPGEYGIDISFEKKKIVKQQGKNDQTGTGTKDANPDGDQQEEPPPGEEEEEVPTTDTAQQVAAATLAATIGGTAAVAAASAGLKAVQSRRGTLPKEILEATIDFKGLRNIDSQRGFDYAPGPAPYPIRFHGFNYVITDLGLRKWSFMQSEEPIITIMRVPGGSHLLSPSQVILNKNLTGRTDINKTAALQRRFGARARTTQQIFIPNLYGSIGNARVLLDAFAFGLLQQVNGLGDGGTLNLSGRPDLELGHNVVAAERQKLYYITGADYTFSEGKDASSTLTLSYGHDFATEIPNPWSLVDLSELLSTVGAQREANTKDDKGTQVVDTTQGTFEPILEIQFGKPLDTVIITGGWGRERDGGTRSHRGADIRGQVGTPMFSATGGVVTRVQRRNASNAGRHVEITTRAVKGSVICRYLHMDTILPGIRVGQPGSEVVVELGQQIGTVGITGVLKSGPHLHLDIFADATYLQLYLEKFGDPTPLPKERRGKGFQVPIEALIPADGYLRRVIRDAGNRNVTLRSEPIIVT